MPRLLAPALLLSLAGWAAPSRGQGSERHVSLQVGGAEVIAIEDGVQTGVSELLGNVEAARLKELLAQAGDVHAPTSVNVYLLKLGKRIVLVDAGGGNSPPYRGKLARSLLQHGVAPAQVTDVLITHLHADHVGGLLNEAGAQFPDATVHVQTDEAAFWLAPDLASRVPDQFRQTVLAIQSAVAPYAASARLKTFEYNAEVVPGIVAKDASGHTPGHTVFLWTQRGDVALFWGDLIHVPGVQLAHPDVGIRFDSKPALARATREKWLNESAGQGWTVFGAHMPFPGIGVLVKDQRGLRWSRKIYPHFATP